VGGKPETKVDYGDPVEKARIWKKLGATMLHIIDLDATLGLGQNIKTILRIKRVVGLPIQIGGGIRTVELAGEMLSKLEKEDRIIIGTMIVDDYCNGFAKIKGLNEKYGSDRIIAAVDSKKGYVTVHGWSTESKLKTIELMKACEKHVWGFLYTDVDVEGLMSGIRVDSVKKIIASTNSPVIIAGGVSGSQDIEDAKTAGAWATVLGKALYEDKIDITEYM